jgi:hypothetical protein
MRPSINKSIILIYTALLGVVSSLSAADLNILVIGSSKDSGERHNSSVWWDGTKPAFTPTSKPFSPTEIGNQLQNILQQDNRGSVNVTVTDRYGSQAIYNGWTAYSYNLSTWFHYPFATQAEGPAENETNRWSNLRGEEGTEWDYVVVIGDPYTMEYTPGVYSLGVAKIAEEVAKGSAELVVFMPWQGTGSSSSVNHYKEVVYRTARSGDHKVAPGALAWQACGSPSDATHPNSAGAYIAAASIYSSIYNQSAAASGYVISDANANTTFTTYTANNTASQYTGKFSFQNPYLILDDKMRHIRMSERGTSTEQGFKGKIKSAMDRSKVTYTEYNDGSYTNNIPTGTVWTTNPMPISFNYGRDGFYSEDYKSYLANPAYWQLGFGYYYQNGTAGFSTEIANDSFIGLMQMQDNDLANRMINEAPIARNLPTRSLWAQIHKEYPTLNPMRDSAHLSYNWDEAVGTYLYTIYSGRCPLDPKPVTDDIVWTCRKIGYETAWLLGRCQTRAPGFKVSPSAANKKSITDSTTETMRVEFILPPTNDVTVTVSSSNTGAAIVSPKTLIFTPQNYNIPQYVTVAGIPRSSASDAFNVDFITLSDDEVYAGLSDSWEYTTSSTVTVTQVDNGVTLVNAMQNQPKTINLGVSGAIAGNTVFAGPFHGSITWSGVGVIEYTPSLDFIGVDQIAYAVTTGGTQTIGFLDITVVIPNGQVSASASDPSATEEGPTTGSWTISRLGETTDAIDVFFILTGTADLGSDYTVSHTSPLTIPAEQSSVTITLTPIDDTVFGEGDETAILTVTPDSAYPVGTASATITIVDNDNNAPVVDAGNDQTVTLDVSSIWTPAEIATYSWYDASDATTLWADVAGTMLATTSVARWDDKSQNNKNAIQSNGGKQPTTGTRTIGGSNAMNFDATEDFDVPSFDLMGKECWTVIKKDTADDFHVLGSSSNIQVGVLSSGKMRIWGNSSYPSDTQSTELISVGSDYVLGFRALNPKQFSINGTIEATSNVPSGNALTINHIMDNQYAHNSDGLIGEIIVTAGELTTAERQRMEGYLAWKWGMVTNLPTGHPHKDASPGNPGVIVDLVGEVNDPDNDLLTTNWSQFSGPAGGTVTFGDTSAIVTTATFTEAGTYVLYLNADDGYGPILDEVTITVNASSPLYTAWADTFGAGFTENDLNSNPDGDTMTNQQEFAFGADPTLNNGGSLAMDGSVHGLPIPASIDGGVTFDFYFLRRKDHGTSGSITYTPQFSSDLSSFSASVDTPAVVVESTVDAAYEVVKVPYAAGTRFGRVKTDVTP